jgi:hypothetical protein
VKASRIATLANDDAATKTRWGWQLLLLSSVNLSFRQRHHDREAFGVG